MDNINLKDRQIVVAGPGKVWATIINNFANDFEDILVWNRSGEYQWFPSYPIGKLSEIDDISDNAIGIITAIWDGANKALDDFAQQQIPVALLSTVYDKKILEKYSSQIPILKAPNAAIPIVELMQIFEEYPDFSKLYIQIQESHQPGKNDPSGTARKIINMINAKGGSFNYDHEKYKEDYKPDNWISVLWDLRTYRWDASDQLWVPKEHLDGHGYHRYTVWWTHLFDDYLNFRDEIEHWYKKYQNHNFTWLSLEFFEEEVEQSFVFSHNVDGREIYADGLREILPWFLEQEVGIYSVTDYLQQNYHE